MMCPPCDRSSRHGTHRAHVCDQFNPNTAHGYECSCGCTNVPAAADELEATLAGVGADHLPVVVDGQMVTDCSCGHWEADLEQAWDLSNDWLQYLHHLATQQAAAIRGTTIPAKTGVTP